LSAQRDAQSRRCGHRRRYAPGASTVETFFTALLVVVFLLVTWFAGFVVVKLFKGQTR
jgi:hypothetical protein